jgi:DNA primase
MSIIEEIKQKSDIVEVIGQYVQLKKSGSKLKALCPFHTETSPSFFVYPDQQTWRCFGACNTGGDVFSFLMKKENVDFKGAMQILAERAGVQIPSKTSSPFEDQQRDILFEINHSAAQYFHNLLVNNPSADPARKYLQKRGVNDKSASDFLLGYSLQSWDALKNYLNERGFEDKDILSAGLLVESEKTSRKHDRFRHKIIFPIMDDKARVTGFGSRVLDDSTPKYINSPQTRIFDKSGSLYGIHLAKNAIRKADTAILVEGYMDVIISHQFGYSNVISPMGVAVTERQINQIKRLSRNVILALDPDSAGEEASLRCISYENTLDSEVKVITLPDGKDPDEVLLEDKTIWEQALEKAVPVIEYAIKYITGKLDMRKSSDKTEAINKILPILSEVKAAHRQYDYLTKLAMAVKIDEKVLEASLKRYQFDSKSKFLRPSAIQKATRIIRSNPLEEYLLSLLIQHPELKIDSNIQSDYFESSENKELFEYVKNNNAGNISENDIDTALKELYDQLAEKKLPATDVEKCYADCIMNLRRSYLLKLQKRHTELLSYIAETGEKNADLQKLEDLGLAISEELNKLEKLKSKLHGVILDEKR